MSPNDKASSNVSRNVFKFALIITLVLTFPLLFNGILLYVKESYYPGLGKEVVVLIAVLASMGIIVAMAFLITILCGRIGFCSKVTQYYLLKWESRKVRRWAKIREKGKWHCIVRHYALLWGVAVATVLSAWRIYVSPSPLDLPGDLLRILVFHFTTFPILYFFIGIPSWYANEKEYTEAVRRMDIA